MVRLYSYTVCKRLKSLAVFLLSSQRESGKVWCRETQLGLLENKKQIPKHGLKNSHLVCWKVLLAGLWRNTHTPELSLQSIIPFEITLRESESLHLSPTLSGLLSFDDSAQCAQKLQGTTQKPLNHFGNLATEWLSGYGRVTWMQCVRGRGGI